MAEHAIPTHIGGKFPNIKAAASTNPEFDMYEYKKDKWLVFFSHPNDFTPVCTTEFGKALSLTKDFEARGVVLLGLSPNDVESHIDWGVDIVQQAKDNLDCGYSEMTFPIISDKGRELAKALNILSLEDFEKDGLPESCRAVQFVSPDNKLKASIVQPPSVGRSFDEILRVIDALQLAAKHKLAAPEGWKKGDKMMITPVWSQEDAEKQFGKENIEVKEVPSTKKYLRYVDIK